jgi:hypothetical protein
VVVGGWKCLPSTVPTRQSGSGHKKWSDKGVWKNIMNSLVSRGYTSGLIKIDDLSVDSSTVAAKKRGNK